MLPTSQYYTASRTYRTVPLLTTVGALSILTPISLTASADESNPPSAASATTSRDEHSTHSNPIDRTDSARSNKNDGEPDATRAGSDQTPSDSNNAPDTQTRPDTIAESAANESTAVNSDAATNTLPTRERRGGYVIGVLAGPTLGWAVGNPSGKMVRDDPSYERHTGSAFGYRLTPFVGGAPVEWFAFGVGASFADFYNNDYTSPVITFLFRVEMYPLHSVRHECGSLCRDVGVSLGFGAGVSSVKDASTGEKVADAGGASTFAAGVFWEPLRFSYFGMGPHLSFQHNRSRWYARDDFELGLRLICYGEKP